MKPEINFMPNQLKYLIGAVVLVLGLAGVLFYAQPESADHTTMNDAAGQNSLNLSVEPANYDFGNITMKDGLVTKSFKIVNTQDAKLKLAQAYTSCMCTTAKIVINQSEFGPFGMQGHGVMKMLNQTLDPGQEAELLVTFDPNAHGPSGIGVIERTVTLQSDQGETVSVNIKATVTP